MKPSTFANRIDHVVVVMLENRSFDHVLGSLSLDEGRGDINGLKVELEHSNSGADDLLYEVHPLAKDPNYGERAARFPYDPPHGWESVELQVRGGAMSGFICEHARKHPEDKYPRA